MASYREEEDPFEEDIVFDQAGLLTNTTKMNTAIRRVSSGKCALFAKTLGLCGAFFGLGLCIAIPGPTFLSPVTELQANISPISSIYAARTSGYFIGSIIGGFLFDYFNRLFLLFISLLLTAVFITVTPWCQVLWLLQACMIFLGMTMGFLDTGGNVLCLDLWGRNSGPFMQALHFSFGLGAFVAPLLAAPFLESSNMEVLPTTMSSTPITFENSDLRGKRAASSYEDILTEEPHIWLTSTPKSLENISNPSINISIYGEFVTDSSASVTVESNIKNGLEINSSTIKSIPTTQKIPNQKKPKNIDAAKLGSPNCENCHVKSPSKEISTTTTTTTMNTSTTTPASLLTTVISTKSPDSVVEVTSVHSINLSTSNTQAEIKSESEIISIQAVTTVSNLKVSKDINNSEDIHIAPGTSIGTTSLSNASNPFSISNNPVSLTSESFPSSLMLKMSKANDSIAITKEANTQVSIQKENDSSMVVEVGGTGTSHLRYNDHPSNSDANTEGSFSIQNEKKNMETKEKYTLSKNNTVVSSVLNATRGTTSTSSFTPQLKLTESLEESRGMLDCTDSSIAGKPFIVENNKGISETSAVPVTDHKSHSNSDENLEVQGQTTTPSVHSSWTEKEETSPMPMNMLPKRTHHKPNSVDNDIEEPDSLLTNIANRIEKYGFSKIQFTYLMVGLFVFAISLVFLGFLCHNPRDPKSKQEEGQGAKKISNKVLHGLLISLMAIFFLLYVGLEVTYGQLVLAFAVHGDLRLARSTGLVIAIVFWGSFAAMRFASIFFSSGFGPVTMLLLNFVFCTLGTVLLSSMASQTETALWVGTALLGIGLASVFPTGILWIERYIHVSNKVAAAFVMGASLGEMLCPITVYHLMVNNPAMLMHSAVVINILCILTFIALRCLAVRHGEKYCAASNNGYQLANQDEEEDMIDMSPSGSVIALRRHSFSSEHRALLNGNPHRGP